MTDGFESERENVGPGWQPLIEELDAKLRAIDPNYRVLQVKEKFGGLRYYATISTVEQNDLIAEAEANSYLICEMCGSATNVSTKADPGRYWIKTSCDDCREGRTK